MNNGCYSLGNVIQKPLYLSDISWNTNAGTATGHILGHRLVIGTELGYAKTGFLSGFCCAKSVTINWKYTFMIPR